MTYEEVMQHFNKESLAGALKVSVYTVMRWEGKKIPQHYQLAIQTLTKNKLKADES